MNDQDHKDLIDNLMCLIAFCVLAVCVTSCEVSRNYYYYKSKTQELDKPHD